MKRTRKSKHNKKRNTAFLYEVIIQDITRSVVSGDHKRKEIALGICKDFFSKGKVLHKEKELYDSLSECSEIESDLLEKLLSESKREYDKLDKKEVFNMQTKVINRINKELPGGVFNNFISSYKNLATISQILRQDLPVKKRVVLENLFVRSNSDSSNGAPDEMKPTDNLVYKTFVENYNKKYENSLLEEQREVVTRYATSFSDNGVSLKIYLNEELGRLKNVIRSSLEQKFILEDDAMASKTREVLNILESYAEEKQYNEGVIVQILEIQNLAKEMES